MFGDFYYMYPLLHRTIAAVSATDGWIRDEQMVRVRG